MLEHLHSYINGIYSSSLFNRLVWAVIIAFIFEALVWLIGRRLRRAFEPVMQRDVYLDATERVRRRRVILGLPLLLLRALLYGIGLIIVLRYLGFNTNAELVPLTVGLLAVTVVIGWRVFHDVVAGYFILYDNLYAVGDRVTIGDLAGTVVDVGLRFTRLRASDGRELIVANDSIRQVVNHTRAGDLERRIQR
jgi:small conductance mechanosensitive channel